MLPFYSILNGLNQIEVDLKLKTLYLDSDQTDNEDSAVDEPRALNEDECDLDNEMTTQVIVSELNALASNIDELLSDVDVEYL